MLKNYLKVALRNIRKYKAYSLINLLGLAIGLASCIAIALYIQDELNFDSYHANHDRIFRVVQTEQTPEGARKDGSTVAPLAPTVVSELPEVARAARLVEAGRMTVRNGETRFYEEFNLVDADLFEILDFDFIAGDASAMSEPTSAILTQETAKKYFGDEPALGKTLSSDRGFDFKVAGVIKSPPANSHLQFDMLFSLATLQSNERARPFFERWDSDGFQTYVLLKDPAQAYQVTTKMNDMMQRHKPEDDVDRQLALQPLTDMHFYSGDIEDDRNANKGDIAYIYIFGAIALFIVLIACINYMNLATARSIGRASEVGLRKVVGAQRWQLVGQFLSESVIMACAALVVAYAVVQNLLPRFNAFTGKELTLHLFSGGGAILVLFLLMLVVGVLAGSYPAFYLSKLQVINVLKGKMSARRGTALLRRSLVVTQFVLSIVMVIATLVAFKQMDYIQNKRLGFNKSQLVVVDINSGAARRNFAEIRNEFLQNPRVESVSVTSRVPGEWKSIVELEVIPEGKSPTDARRVSFFGVDENFLNTFEVELAAGRNFRTVMTTDTTGVLINEAAAKTFGWDEPVGKTFTVERQNGSLFTGHVIGVVKDFHFRSLHEKIGPLLLGHSHNPIHNIDYFTAKIAGTDVPATLQYLQSVHEKYDAVTPFEYHFLDQQIDNFYRADMRVSQLFGLAGGLAIFVSCLGLFGLAAFTAEQRTKEIGVRKVLGASINNIVLLLTFEFTRLVALALVIAAPLAWYATHQWLAEFAYHAEVGLQTFIYAGAIALVIAWLTVSVQAVKAAVANPIDSLRYE